MTLLIAEHVGYLVAIASLLMALRLRPRREDQAIRRLIGDVAGSTAVELELRQLLSEATRLLNDNGHTSDAMAISLRAAGIGSERYIAREITR